MTVRKENELPLRFRVEAVKKIFRYVPVSGIGVRDGPQKVGHP